MRAPNVFLAISLILFLTSSIFVSSGDRTAYACSCMQPLSPDEEMSKFDAVFSGKAIKIEGKQPNALSYSSADPVFVTFDVDKVWKGTQIDTITIQTALMDASCGFYFEDGLSYIVYANQLGDTLNVSLCSRTSLLSNAVEDLQELGSGLLIGSKLLSPLKQFKSGVSFDEIKCKEGLQLVTKYDNTPACLKEDSIMQLEMRGWIDDDAITYSDTDDDGEKLHSIPVHVYEIWDSQGIVIHGNVEKQDDSNAVEIQIKDQQGKIIDATKVMPDDSGRFIYGVTKFISDMLEIDPKWENVTSYDVSAFYKYPASIVIKESNMLNSIALNKNKVPLDSVQISNLSHDEIIQIIKNWREIGGIVPFTTLSIIGMNETYSLGEPITFAVQKSGYGNPCPNQGIVIFDEDTKEHVATELYMEICINEENSGVSKEYDYLIPYNLDAFLKIPPITKPGNYVMVANSDSDAKDIKRFTVLDSDHTFEYKLVYSMQRDSTSNKRVMEIDLTDGIMSIENPQDRTVTEASLDSETLVRLNSEIAKNNFVSNPFTNQLYGEFCDACDFGQIRLYIDGIMVHQITWDARSLEKNNSVHELGHGSPESGEFSSYYNLVDCISSKNNFDTHWISDSTTSTKNYADTAQTCDELIEESSRLDVYFPGQNMDYDFFVHDMPRTNFPQSSGKLGDSHEHASILVKIFGDKFDFSRSDYQIKNPFIHFEGSDGNTIHRHATGIKLGLLFESMNMKITDECFVFADGREFCTNEDYTLKFYINGENTESILNYVVNQEDRILVSYGPETQKEIKEQIKELDLQEIIN